VVERTDKSMRRQTFHMYNVYAVYLISLPHSQCLCETHPHNSLKVTLPSHAHIPRNQLPAESSRGEIQKLFKLLPPCSVLPAVKKNSVQVTMNAFKYLTQ